MVRHIVRHSAKASDAVKANQQAAVDNGSGIIWS